MRYKKNGKTNEDVTRYRMKLQQKWLKNAGATAMAIAELINNPEYAKDENRIVGLAARLLKIYLLVKPNVFESDRAEGNAEFTVDMRTGEVE